MKTIRAFLILFLWTTSFVVLKANNIVFRENKGQIINEKGNSVSGVRYSCETPSMLVHFQNNGIKYQLHKTFSWTEDLSLNKKRNNKVPKEVNYYSVDLNWVGANPEPILEPIDQIPGIENFYTNDNSEGVLNVKSFKKLIYHDLYDGVDVVWYQNGKNLKYDYVVKNAVDYKKIKISCIGSKPYVNRKGQLVFKTELGEIKEDAPIVFQNGKQLKSKWIVKDNIIEFEINNLDPSQSLIIDPVLLSWGTFYGGANTEEALACATDNQGCSYIGGYSESGGTDIIATSGGFLTTLLGGRASFIAKFDSLGVRQWGTYLGQNDGSITSLKTDSAQNIYFTGGSSVNGYGYSSIGAYQFSPGGNGDAILGKFDKYGIRMWSTYYGGTVNEAALGLSIDKQGNLLICGAVYTSGSSGVLTSTGCHQNIYGGGPMDGWLAKFDNNGNRIWGTYLGGENYDQNLAIGVDNHGNIFVSGGSNSTTGISTPGAYLSSPDSVGGFLQKFDPNGARLWGTYCIGAEVRCLNVDVFDNVIMYEANSHFVIQKFSNEGSLLWTVTEIGSIGGYGDHACVSDVYGNIYITGSTQNSDSIFYSTTGSFQTQHSDNTNGVFFGMDGYIEKFNANGEWIWGTYFGNAFGSEFIEDISICKDYVIVCGFTTSTSSDTVITPSAHQTIYGGGSEDVILAKFYQPCIDPTAPMVTADTSILCQGDAVTLSLGGNLNSAINWYFSIDSCNGTIVDSTMAHSIQLRPSQTTTYYIKAGRGCISNPTICESITITVKPKPNVTLTASNDTVCSGESNVQLNANGAVSYIWFNGDNDSITTVVPVNSGYYSVNSTGLNGCSWNDSIYIYTHPSYLISQNKLLCNGLSYTWHGNTYNTSGIYYDSLTTITGCDSVFSLNLSTTTTQYLIHDTATMCPGGSYSWHGNTYNASGTYYDYLTTYYGCDSTHILHLSVTTINNSVTVSGNSISSNEGSIGATYQWIDCLNGMSPIAFENNQTLNITWSGTYAVQVHLNGCVSTSPCTPVTMIGVEELTSDNEFMIYPNPSNGSFTVIIGSGKFEKGEFRIIDITGRIVGVYSLNNNKNKTQINTNELSEGIYFYSIILDEEVKTAGKLTILK